MSTSTKRTVALEAIFDHLAGRVDALAARAARRIEEQSPIYRELPPAVLAAALRPNVERGIAVLRARIPPSEEELASFSAAAIDRALQGFPLQDVLRAYRIGVAEMWEEFSLQAAARRVHVEDVLELSSAVMAWEDAVADAVAGAHAGVGLQLAREDQQRRDAVLRAILIGTLRGDDLRRAGAGFGLDAEQGYVPSRIRAATGRWEHGLTARVERGLGGRPGVVGQVDGDVVAIAAGAPEAVPDTTIAVGPPVALEALPASFAEATRALQVACAFGLTGVVDLGSLSIRPAVLAEGALGALFEARRLGPLDGMGHIGIEIERTLRTWLALGMRHEETARALHVHPNSLRHRLRRYEQLTGSSLRDVTTLVELWWALERRGMVA